MKKLVQDRGTLGHDIKGIYEYRQKESGGFCLTRCHVEMTYDRVTPRFFK